MHRLLNRLKEPLLIASLPLILLATLYVIVILFWLLVIVLAALMHSTGLLLLPAAYTLVPTALWPKLGLEPFVQLPREEVHILTLGQSWPDHAGAFLHTAGWHAVCASWPYVITLVLIWLLAGYRHQRLWTEIAMGLDTLPPGAAPWLEEQLRALATAAKLPVPRLTIWRSAAPNAFASGLNDATYKVTVTTGLLEQLTPPQLRAVLAHELGHIAAGDVRLLTLCHVYGGFFSSIADYLWRNVTDSLSGANTIYNRLLFSLPLVAVLALLFSFAGGLATLVRSFLIRGRELGADRFAVELMGEATPLATALATIGAYQAPPPKQRLIRDSVIHAPARHWWQRWTATHPSMARRQKALTAFQPRI